MKRNSVILDGNDSHNGSEQPADRCGHCRGQRAPERDAQCARRHSCAARARSYALDVLLP
jgi:hypothetical protein